MCYGRGGKQFTEEVSPFKKKSESILNRNSRCTQALHQSTLRCVKGLFEGFQTPVRATTGFLHWSVMTKVSINAHFCSLWQYVSSALAWQQYKNLLGLLRGLNISVDTWSATQMSNCFNWVMTCKFWSFSSQAFKLVHIGILFKKRKKNKLQLVWHCQVQEMAFFYQDGAKFGLICLLVCVPGRVPTLPFFGHSFHFSPLLQVG